MALKDWEDIQAFESDAVGAQHLDVVYILRQLTVQKAFCFTAMPTLVELPLTPALSHQSSFNNSPIKLK